MSAYPPLEFSKNNPKIDIPHPEVVDWTTNKWKRRTGKVLRDPDRGIRKLHEEGYLIKVKKGAYRYNLNAIDKKDLEDFTAKQKEQILNQDKYKCVICGRGKKDAMELHVDHIKPKYLDGKATIDNGQTLCSQHNFIKKNLKQTETGKKVFIRLYELAKTEENKELINFSTDVLKMYKNTI